MHAEDWGRAYTASTRNELPEVKREFSLEKLAVEKYATPLDMDLTVAEKKMREQPPGSQLVFVTLEHVCNEGKKFAILPSHPGFEQIRSLAADVLRDFAIEPALRVTLPCLTYVNPLVYTAWHDTATGSGSYADMQRSIREQHPDFQLNNAILSSAGKYSKLTFHFGYFPKNQQAEAIVKKYEAQLKRVLISSTRIKKQRQTSSPFAL
jgi:hypothetical protein